MRRLPDQGSFFYVRKWLFCQHFKKISASCLFIFLTVLCLSSSAGTRFLKTISGKIMSTDGAVLSGATVKIKGTNSAVTTDNDGHYSIDIPDAITDPVLVVSSVGYVSTEVPVSGKSNLDGAFG